jgi:hypothetical protein
MDKQEAAALLTQELEKYPKKTYHTLLELKDETIVSISQGSSSVTYQI